MNFDLNLYILGEAIERSPFGENSADHFVGYLTGALLIGALGITKEDAAAELAGGYVALNGQRISKLAAPVGKDDRKERLKHFSAEDRVKGIEDFRHRSGCVVIPQKCEHEPAVGEEDGEQDFPAPSAFNGVHLDNSGVRIGGHVFKIILVGSPQVALFVYPNRFLLFADTVANFSRQVDVAHGEQTGVDVVVDRLLIQHDLVGVVRADMMNGLPLLNQWGDDVIDAPQFFRRGGDPLTAFAACGLVLFLRSLGVIQVTAKRAAISFFATITDIRRLLVLWAELLFEVFADFEAGNAAFGAVLGPFVLAGNADIPAVFTDIPVTAGIAPAAAVFDDEMVSDFL